MLRLLAGLQFPAAPSLAQGLQVPEGQWEGSDPTGPPAQPPRGGGGDGGVRVGLTVGGMSYLEQTRQKRRSPLLQISL